MKIRVLPDNVINQISAGEVVDRPASVVRELVDNSVDAGATEVAVTLEQGGHSLISVTDNGCGMERDDALLAFERHATSKVKETSDLLSIATMGFRGEALASIASIAKVSLRTKVKSANVATEVKFDGGTLKGATECAGNIGTTIEVRNIFYNTPARRKFLKSPKTEELRIKQWLMHSSISRPDVRYKLISDGNQLLSITKARSVLERGAQFFQGTTVPVDYESGKIVVRGIVSHPSLAQADTGSFVVLINSRLVSDRMIQKAVREGFDSTLKDREYPVGFIHIELPPEDVDVNVHPQKSEVRFRNSQSIFLAVREGVLAAVREFRLPVQSPASYSTSGNVFQHAWTANQSESAWTTFQQPVTSNAVPQSFEWRVDSSPAAVVSDFKFADIKLIGQVMSCFLIGELKERLYCIDMHAAHERYNYNIIRNSFKNKEQRSQQLLIPETVELGAEGVAACLGEIDTFTRFGFEIEPFGDTAVVVRALPSAVKAGVAKQLIKEVAALAGEMPGAGRFEERLDHMAARIACHASIRSGEELVREEAYALLEALDRSEFSAACPHGRPIIVSFSRDEVERWFGRDR